MSELPRARTLVEMLFAASLEACAHCGSTHTARLDLSGQGDRWMLSGSCPACRRDRTFTWHTEGHPLEAAFAPRNLGDTRASAIIRPGQFIAELDRLLPRIVLTPRRLAPTEWYASRDALNRVITCLIELQKFVAPGAAEIANDVLTSDERADRIVRPERYERAWLAEELDRAYELLARYAADTPRIDALERAAGLLEDARGALDEASLEAHQGWLRAGRAGPGRLEVVAYDAPSARLSQRDLSAARLVDIRLERAVLEGASLSDAEVRKLRAEHAHMTALDLQRAHIQASSFARSTLTLARLDGAVLEASDLRGARFDRSSWHGARVRGCLFDDATFGNALLDGAELSGCSFVRADLRRFSRRFDATTRAVFEDCDLRNSRWYDRDVAGAVFIRCKLAGVSGTPTGLDQATFIDPDLSPEGDGSDIAEADEVRQLWK